ncbi:MAG: hypothetical protein ACFFC6_07365 [Promethearchaeota archaeon]
MNAIPRQERFYLLSVDILKGMAVFPMLFSHSVGWWNETLSRNYDTLGSFAVVFIWFTGLMVFPCFLFIYGFNQVNSFIRKKENSSSYDIRSHAIKRSIVFFLFASLALAIMSFIQAPEKLFNYLLTWHLLHLFAFSTLFLLILWELASWLEKKTSWSFQRAFTALLFSCFFSTITLFIFFHDYTVIKENSRLFPVTLDVQAILEGIFLDVSSCGLIPWLSFPLAGGITASIFNLPFSSEKSKILQKATLLFVVNTLFLIFGVLYLRKERFISAGLGFASSFPHVFISIGFIGCVFIVLILTLDIFQIYPHKSSFRLFYPIVVVSKISLTVYLVHPVIGIFDPSLIPSEEVLLLLVFLYGLFFIILAHMWQKRDFKYSFEWIIRKYS